MPTIAEIYHGSNAADTRKLLDRVRELGHAGRIAAVIFRLQKTAARWRSYKGSVTRGDYSVSRQTLAKEYITEAAAELARLLTVDDYGIAWGWHFDRHVKFQDPEHVLIVELPAGQVSWHVISRGVGPDFAGLPDAVDRETAEQRVLAHVSSMIEPAAVPALFG
jgi:hypothetical protein